MDAGSSDANRKRLRVEPTTDEQHPPRVRIDSLVTHLEPSASWPQLVLPGQQLEILKEVASHVGCHTPLEGREFEPGPAFGLGVRALFSGRSGTGKTMAAEVLARHLGLDLLSVDLSQVVNKYIGETEKNLRRVFDLAERLGAILLFDEADALFGKRTDVKDSHDRYANLEVSHLLTGMETYRGLTILTTNRMEAIDDSFLRRVRFIVEFPFPGEKERGEIWRGILPANAPRADLNFDKLARLTASGGEIRDIALTAAVAAADDGKPVSMDHLLRAVRIECGKQSRPVEVSEVAGWV